MIARTHAESIPALPGLGKALRSINITMPVPRLEFPADPNKPDDPDDEDDSKHLGFIRGATVRSSHSKVSASSNANQDRCTC